MIFTLSKSWLSFVAFVVTLVGGLFATLLTGKNQKQPFYRARETGGGSELKGTNLVLRSQGKN